MDRNYLLTFSYQNEEGFSISSFSWNDTLEELKEDILDYKKHLNDFDVIEIVKINSCEILDEFDL